MGNACVRSAHVTPYVNRVRSVTIHGIYIWGENRFDKSFTSFTPIVASKVKSVSRDIYRIALLPQTVSHFIQSMVCLYVGDEWNPGYTIGSVQFTVMSSLVQRFAYYFFQIHAMTWFFMYCFFNLVVNWIYWEKNKYIEPFEWIIQFVYLTILHTRLFRHFFCGIDHQGRLLFNYFKTITCDTSVLLVWLWTIRYIQKHFVLNIFSKAWFRWSLNV